MSLSIEEHLKNTEQMLLSEAALANVPLTKFINQHILQAGGKRIRPQLCLMIGQILGDITQKHYYAATAIEFIHTATLLHDDVIDQGAQRRGKKTANIIWGNKSAILSGDHLFARAFSLLVKTENIPTLQSLSKTSEVLAEGEILQLSLQNKIPTHKEYMEIINAKTSSLFSAACKVGAYLSGSSDDICHQMKELGHNIGYIFQIIDDLIDYTGTQAVTGKPVGNDFIEGKFTLPLILLHEKLPLMEQESLKSMMSKNNNRTLEDFNYLIANMKKYDIFKIIRERAEKIYHNSQIFINVLPDGSPRGQLHNLFSTLIQRVS